MKNNLPKSDTLYTPHSCNNCKYYAEHYIKCDTKFIALAQGHCKQGNKFLRNLIRNTQWDRGCDKWESNNTKRDEQKKSIKLILSNIEKSLGKIAEVLNNDE